MIFMALIYEQQADHRTIAEFISTMQEQIQPLLRDVLMSGSEFSLSGVLAKRASRTGRKGIA